MTVANWSSRYCMACGRIICRGSLLCYKWTCRAHPALALRRLCLQFANRPRSGPLHAGNEYRDRDAMGWLDQVAGNLAREGAKAMYPSPKRSGRRRQPKQGCMVVAAVIGLSVIWVVAAR